MSRQHHAPLALYRALALARGFTVACAFVAICSFVAACGDGAPPSDDPGDELRQWSCELEQPDDAPDYVQRIGCAADFDALASEPLDSSIPGARSLKVIYDRIGSEANGPALYYQNSARYLVHYDFAAEHLSGGELPFVASLAEFNDREYYAPERRFILGAVTYYEEPDAWALEIAPYDTASAEMVATLFSAVRDSSFFGTRLRFHPTSDAVEGTVDALPSEVGVTTTSQLFAQIDYQPLNLGSAIGRLRFLRAADLETEYVSFRDVVVLDHVPNDISVVSGLITEEFQTPLSHVNVLSQNRGTPNMGLRDATDNEALRALEGAWVRLSVAAFEYTIEEVSSEEADAFWQDNRPEAVAVPRLDTSVTELADIGALTQEEVDGEPVALRDAIKAAIPAYGGKASHFSILKKTEGVPVPDAFSVPVYYYVQFLEQNGFDERIDDLLDDPDFRDDPEIRSEALDALRADMQSAPVDPDFQDALRDKLAAFPEERIRFRSSTNAEDLDGFTGAGLYTSRTGVQSDWEDVLDAVRTVWSSVWYFRAFEEREYRGIDHRAVGMALLVHRSFPDLFEAANGVALTANPFDPSGLEPGFYINVQQGASSVVQPEDGMTTDQMVYHFNARSLPIVYLSHSSLVPEDGSVLTTRQVHELGQALDAIHRRFSAAYGPGAGNTGWYAMETEFKFFIYEPGQEPELVLKQARPHPGRGEL